MGINLHGPQTIDHRPQTTDHRLQTTDHRPQTMHRPRTTHFKSFLLPDITHNFGTHVGLCPLLLTFSPGKFFSSSAIRFEQPSLLK